MSQPFLFFSVPRLPRWGGLVLCGALVLPGCGAMQVGFTIPVGPHTGVGVSVGSDGRIGVGVGVSAGGGTVSVGTSGQLPVNKDGDTDEQK